MSSSSIIHPEIRAAMDQLANGEKVLNEAEFGYKYVKRYLADLPGNVRVLEIGSGPCILLSQIRIDFPDLDISGIEPIGPGFDNFGGTLQEMINQYQLNLFRAGYEDFDESKKYDFIFSINVFEHLADWRHFLNFVCDKLNKDGKCLILCPNYNFPYESHFGLPILINKAVTYSIFRKKIRSFELENNYAGLWDSLNFVKWTRVRKHLSNSSLAVSFRLRMLREMIERLSDDKNFAQRQKKLAFLARLLLKMGIVRVFELPFLSRFHPYMHLEISHKTGR